LRWWWRDNGRLARHKVGFDRRGHYVGIADFDCQAPYYVSGRYRITHCYGDFLDNPVIRRRYIHGGLVGLERNQAIFLRDFLARLDQDFYDLDVGEIAKVGNDDVDYVCHQSVTGSGFSGSIPNFSIACTTVC